MKKLYVINHWPPQWQYLFKQGYEVAVTPEILEPLDSMVYYKDDTIDFKVQWTMTYGGGVETWVEEYKINSGDYPPGMHTFKAEGWNPEGPAYDSVSLCIFDFYIRENLVKKYFNPLKPDSARISFAIIPQAYADPEIPPNPISMTVEIRDCDSNVVYNDILSPEEQLNQVYWWDGKDNTGKYTDPEKSPYFVDMKLTYREAKGRRLLGFVKRSTKTNNAPGIVGVPILTRTNISEIPTSRNFYLDTPGDLRFSTVILCKVKNTGNPLDDYKCYHPNPLLISPTVRIYNPDWPAPHEFEFELKPWQVFIWGFLSHLRWCEVKPKIGTTANRVIYSDSTVLGNWVYDNGFGWKWNENVKQMSEGTLRYRVHVENWEAGTRLQEATTPKGIDLYRVSTKGNYSNEIVKWSSSYIDIPYVYGWHTNEYGQMIVKGLHRGFEGNDCSGLAGWSYIWVGEDLDNNPATPDSADINDRASVTDLKSYYGKVNQQPDSARDGDMWYIDYGDPGLDHVGVFYKKLENNIEMTYVIHASYSNNKVENIPFNIKDPNNWWVRYFCGLGRRPRNEERGAK